MQAIFCPHTHLQLLGLAQKVKTFFLLKVVMLHIKLKGNKRGVDVDQHASKILDLTHTPDLWGQVERSDITIVCRKVKFFLTKNVGTKI